MTWRPALYEQNPDVTYEAADDRFIIKTLFTEGVINLTAGGGLVVQRQAGAAMEVYVPPVDVVIDGDDVAGQNSYLARMTVGEAVTVTPASTTNPRIDLLIVEFTDRQYKTPTVTQPGGPHLRLVPGTAAASPTAPALPPTAIALASIAVAANASSITTANITDLRAQAGANVLKVGTQAQPLTAAQIAALSTAERFAGRLIENTTTGRVQHVATAGALPVDVAPVLQAAGVIIDTTTTVPISSSITKRIPVPVGAARGIIGIRAGSTATGGVALFTSTATGAFSFSVNSGLAPVLQHRSVDPAPLLVSAAGTNLNLADAYIDTVTSELVLVFNNPSASTVRTFTLYATYEVF